MKARVDSGEFSTAVKVASRWTTSTGMEATRAIILEIMGDWLLVRTTTGDQDCQLTVNAFDAEPGKIVTGAQMLQGFAWDSGGWLRLHNTKAKLVLDYEDFTKSRIGLLDEEVMDLFPVFLEVGESMLLDSQALLMAANHTSPLDRTGTVLKSAIHAIPQEDSTIILGTDGVVGYSRKVQSRVPAVVSIDGPLLSAAIGAIGDQVAIGVTDHRVQVSAPMRPAKIQFSTMATKADPCNLVNMFGYETPDDPVLVSKDSLKRMQFLCARAALVDEVAEVKVSGDKTVMFEILGREVDIEKTLLAEGCIDPIVFRCDNFARALASLSDVDSYKVWPIVSDGKPFWYIDGVGRHFMMSSAPVMFASKGEEQNI